MRLLRLIALLAAFVALCLAQFIFDHRSLVEFFPRWFLDTFPAFYQFAFWLPDDLLTLAGALAMLGSIGFGLLSTQWIGELSRVSTRAPHTDARRSDGGRYGSGAGLLTLALIASAYVGIRLGRGLPETRAMQALWLFGVALYLVGAVLVDRSLSPRPYRTARRSNRRDAQAAVARPERGWPWLLFILLMAGLAFGWRLESLPVRVEAVVAQSGWEALNIARGDQMALFGPGRTALPLLAYVPAAVGMALSRDVLLGLRLSGFGAGMVTVLATWLLGCELFRRTPRVDSFDVVLEDDGRWIALLAAFIVAVSHVAMHFSRLPIYMAPVAVGALGLWALLRGLRTEDRATLALSGVCVGLAGLLYSSGLFFWLITPLWWIGIWLLRRTWLSNRYRGVGAPGAFVWLGGVLLVILPFVGVWLHEPDLFRLFARGHASFTAAAQARREALYLAQGLNSIFWDNLRLAFLTFNVFPNASSLFNYPGPFLNPALAPVFLLGLGCLVLNLDRLPGWLLLSALGGGLILCAVGMAAPIWVRMLPLLPIAALCTAFGLDRIRLTLLETAGTWLGQTLVYLAVGLIAWAGLHSWTTYFNYAMRRGDASSYTARTVRSLPPGETAVLVIGAQPAVPRDDPVVSLLANDLQGQQAVMELVPDDWPQTLPPESTLLIQPHDRTLLDTARARYPQGDWTVKRNLRSDPVLFVYTVNDE